MMGERRRHMRFRAGLTAEFRSRGTSAAAGYARVEDVSREGMRVEIPQPLAAGELVEFTLQVPGYHVPIVVTGIVIWAAPGAQASGAGIRFRAIDPLDLARMLDYLCARWLGG